MISGSKEAISQVCSVFHRAVELIGKRWSGAVIAAMEEGAVRFGGIREAIPGISDRLLAERLRELEEEGILCREVADSRPPSVSYRLTDKGKALAPILEAIREWGHQWDSGSSQSHKGQANRA